MPKYQQYEVNCLVCGETFKRSGKIGNPPKFCTMACNAVWRIGQKNEKYTIPEQYHDEIRKLYANGTGNGALAEIASRIGVPRTKVYNFAKNNGWIPKRFNDNWSYRWTEDELEVIEATGQYAPKAVQRRLVNKGFNRTITAIEEKRTQLRATQNRGGMTADELAQCMGVDIHNILNAISRDKLIAERRPGYDQPRTAWHIKDSNIRRYIKEWLPEINIGYCDKYWLVDLLSNYRADNYSKHGDAAVIAEPSINRGCEQ